MKLRPVQVFLLVGYLGLENSPLTVSADLVKSSLLFVQRSDESQTSVTKSVYLRQKKDKGLVTVCH